MDALRLSAVTARVVAWHNRHPLARRITAAQVHAIGYVALPFVGEGVASTPSAAAVAAEAIATASASSASATVAAAPLATLNDVVEMPVEPGGLEIDVDDGPAPAVDPSGGGHAPAVPHAPQHAADAAEAGNGSSLRERALARARQPEGVSLDRASMPANVLTPSLTLVAGTLKPNFSEDFIDPLRPRAVARFVARHGQMLDVAPNDGPVRQVQADAVAAGRVAAHLYVLTAVIETDTRKSRVLLGSGSAVMGRRIFSTPRLATVAALGAALVGVPLALWRAPAKPMAPAAAQAAAMSAAAAASSALPPALPMAATAAEAAASVAAAVPAEHAPAAHAAHAAAAGPGASAATSEQPTPQATPSEAGASIVPRLSEEEKALARQARQALRPSPQATPPGLAEGQPAAPSPVAAAAPATQPAPTAAARAPLPTSLQAPAAVAATAAAPPPRAAAPAATVFAVSTRLLRTRAEAEQVSVAMRSLLRTLGENEAKVDVLPQGDDWRVVALPFNRRADAEQARALLVSRGMRVEVLDF